MQTNRLVDKIKYKPLFYDLALAVIAYVLLKGRESKVFSITLWEK